MGTRLERTTSEVDAATKLQSCQRRNMAMKKANSLREEKTATQIQQKQEQAASIKIQAIQRRKQAEKKVAEMKEQKVEAEQAKAAIKIQAIQRRKAAQKEVGQIRSSQQGVNAAIRQHNIERGKWDERDKQFSKEESCKDKRIEE